MHYKLNAWLSKNNYKYNLYIHITYTSIIKGSNTKCTMLYSLIIKLTFFFYVLQVRITTSRNTSIVFIKKKKNVLNKKIR